MLDPLADIHQYSSTLTISQVVKFCEKKDLGLTRAMIQNYIRHGLVPPPADKRVYTHKHLAVLALIGCMKPVFDMNTIKKALCPILGKEGMELESYKDIIKKWAEITAQWKKYMADMVLNDESFETSRLALMIHTADLKELAEESN